MAVTNAYTTLATLKTQLALSDTIDDAALERVITAVSREIDRYCGRRFYTTAADETRYYAAQKSTALLLPDDLLSVTTLATDGDGDRTYEDTWAVADYDLRPDNAALNAEPYWEIAVTPGGLYRFPRGVEKGVKIVGKFGYCLTGSHPAEVEQACLIRCAQMLGIGVAPFGQVGLGETGAVPVTFGTYRGLLDPYRRLAVG